MVEFGEIVGDLADVSPTLLAGLRVVGASAHRRDNDPIIFSRPVGRLLSADRVPYPICMFS